MPHGNQAEGESDEATIKQRINGLKFAGNNLFVQ